MTSHRKKILVKREVEEEQYYHPHPCRKPRQTVYKALAATTGINAANTPHPKLSAW